MKPFMCPYILCNGDAREVVEYYHSVFGGKLELNTFGEFGMGDNPVLKEKVMHSQLTTDGGMVLMVSDTPDDSYDAGTRVSITVFGENESEVMGYWDKLSHDATRVLMPME